MAGTHHRGTSSAARSQTRTPKRIGVQQWEITNSSPSSAASTTLRSETTRFASASPLGLATERSTSSSCAFRFMFDRAAFGIPSTSAASPKTAEMTASVLVSRVWTVLVLCPAFRTVRVSRSLRCSSTSQPRSFRTRARKSLSSSPDREGLSCPLLAAVVLWLGSASSALDSDESGPERQVDDSKSTTETSCRFMSSCCLLDFSPGIFRVRGDGRHVSPSPRETGRPRPNLVGGDHVQRGDGRQGGDE